MTPLAHRIVKELTLPVKRRSFIDDGGILSLMNDVHCFEITEVYDAIHDLIFGSSDNSSTEKLWSMNERLGFLPAPRTWIEWELFGIKNGVLLEECQGSESGVSVGPVAIARTAFYAPQHNIFQSSAAELGIGLGAKGGRIKGVWIKNRDGSFGPGYHGDIEDQATYYAAVIIGALAMINTPRLIGRRQHMPHAGLERALLRARPMVGKFPLHAWTEIKLEVTPSRIGGDGSHEAHFTGQRALHFCRAHLRIRFGKLELVSAHWRGDPALGIKQSRYRVTL